MPPPRSGPGCLIWTVGALLLIPAVIAAWFALALASFVLIPLSVILAARAMRRPDTAGTITGSRVWGRLPGMSSRAGAPGVAGLLLVYGTLIPGLCLAAVLAAPSQGRPGPSPSAVSSRTAVTSEPTTRPAEEARTAAPGVDPTPHPTAGADPTDTPAATAEPTPAPTAIPSTVPTRNPTPRPVPTAPPTPIPPAPTHAQNLCGAPANPYGYNFCGGSPLVSPAADICSYFSCIPNFWKSTNGYVEQCKDGMFSHSGGRSGACSSHQGEYRPLDG